MWLFLKCNFHSTTQFHPTDPRSHPADMDYPGFPFSYRRHSAPPGPQSSMLASFAHPVTNLLQVLADIHKLLLLLIINFDWYYSLFTFIMFASIAQWSGPFATQTYILFSSCLTWLKFCLVPVFTVLWKTGYWKYPNETVRVNNRMMWLGGWGGGMFKMKI